MQQFVVHFLTHILSVAKNRFHSLLYSSFIHQSISDGLRRTERKIAANTRNSKHKLIMKSFRSTLDGVNGAGKVERENKRETSTASLTSVQCENDVELLGELASNFLIAKAPRVESLPIKRNFRLLISIPIESVTVHVGNRSRHCLCQVLLIPHSDRFYITRLIDWLIVSLAEFIFSRLLRPHLFLLHRVTQHVAVNCIIINRSA
jgi:hypothetical protein